MSLFNKFHSGTGLIKGTRLQAGALQISSGIPSFDELLGGGLCLNSLTILLEDRLTSYADIVGRYFVAQGLAHDQQVTVVSDGLESTSENFIETLFTTTKAVAHHPIGKTDVSSQKESDTEDQSTMRIAWRYQSLPRVDTELGSRIRPAQKPWVDNLGSQVTGDCNSDYCSTFDVSKAVAHDQLKLFAPCLSLIDLDNERVADRPLAERLNLIVQHIEQQVARHPNVVKRVLIRSFGSLSYVSDASSSVLQHLYLFLYRIKAIASRSKSLLTVFVIVPRHLYTDSEALKKQVALWESLADGVFHLQSFAELAATQKIQPFLLKDFHGFFHCLKLPRKYGLEPYSTLSRHDLTHLAFKLYRKRFQIDTWRLPPDVDATEDSEAKLTGCTSAAENF